MKLCLRLQLPCGRNQETALFAAKLLNKTKGITIASVGSDGTDGPTDAAGGIVDESSWDALNGTGDTYLQKNDSYFALEKVGSLIKTGPTGTNVNDIVIALIY
ncbi:MOFRL family protein [Anaerorhabdus furcosa]|uniref:MOFRL family protein n=1 Tax=Anaerorhabdus furcosa TaxID=118967 RepID=UPI000998F3BC|nr:MOFRL family protein [Anaerorhabdus furcosa]